MSAGTKPRTRWSSLPHWQHSFTAAALAMGAFVAVGFELTDIAEDETATPAIPDSSTNRIREGAVR